jgi:DNA-binding NarL/FixJ family response regulator
MPGSKPAAIKVLLVDDHAVVLQSLAMALDHEDDIEVVGTAADAAGALAAMKSVTADVAVVDYVLTGLDGIGLASEMHKRVPEMKVLILTAADDDQVLVAAMEAGCAGFLTKGQPLDDVVRAVRTAASGEPVVTSGLLLRLLPQLQRRSQLRSTVTELTDREHEVLMLMAGGATNQVIAQELYLSLHTVRNHVQNVLRKLNAHSKLEAVAIAVKTGVLASRTG